MVEFRTAALLPLLLLIGSALGQNMADLQQQAMDLAHQAASQAGELAHQAGVDSNLGHLENQAMDLAHQVMNLSPADVQTLASNTDYQRELLQLTQQYASNPTELLRRTQALQEKYLGHSVTNGNGNGNGNPTTNQAGSGSAHAVASGLVVMVTALAARTVYVL